MKILCIGQVEKRDDIDREISKQTVQPDQVTLYVDTEPVRGVIHRRKRIAENHKKLVSIVKAYKPDLVWQVEQDCVLPDDCLERLIKHYESLNSDDFGYISGIQVGRHGLYVIGAWRNFLDNIELRNAGNGDGLKSFESIDHTLTGIQQVQATGFYCLLAKTEAWLSGISSWNNAPYGPDVAWGLTMPYKKYVDMSLQIGHRIKGGIIMPEHISTCTVQFKKEDGLWKFHEI